MNYGTIILSIIFLALGCVYMYQGVKNIRKRNNQGERRSWWNESGVLFGLMCLSIVLMLLTRDFFPAKPDANLKNTLVNVFTFLGFCFLAFSLLFGALDIAKMEKKPWQR